MTENPYKLAQGNPAGSLAQKSLTALGEMLSGRAKRKADVADKMLDSDLRIREGRKTAKALGKQDRKTARAEGEVTRKNYSKQVKANVKAAERLTGTAKGMGVAEPGTKFKMTPTSLEVTTKKPKAPATRSRGATAKPARPAPAPKTPATKNKAAVTGAKVPNAPVKGVSGSKSSTPKPTARKAK
jgi:hypothetical protein